MTSVSSSSFPSPISSVSHPDVALTPLNSARSSVSGRKKRPSASRCGSSSSAPLSLSSIIGHTSLTAFSHSVSPASSSSPCIAYIAGNTLIVYNHRTHSVPLLIPGRAGRSLSCCAYSRDGLLIAVGESGHQPAVIVYDAVTGERKAVCEAAHEHHVRCIRWHLHPSIIATVGETVTAAAAGAAAAASDSAGNDELTDDADAAAVSPSVSELCLLDWRGGGDRMSCLLWSCAVDDAVSSLDLSEDGQCIVTCGDRNITHWNISWQQDDSNALAALDGRKLVVDRQEAKLGVHKTANFVSVVCGLGSTSSYTYALTNRGVLCAFTQKDKKKGSPPQPPTAASSSGRRVWAWEIEKWVDLRLDTGYCINIASAAGAALLAIGGAEGKVRLFEPEQLQHVATLPRPPPFIHAAAALSSSPPTSAAAPAPGTYPPTLALSLFPDLSKVVCFYADRSLVVWDARQPKERPIGVVRSFLSHAGCVWDVAVVERAKTETADGEKEVEERQQEAKELMPAGKERRPPLLPEQTVITCAADNSLRFWHLSKDAVVSAKLALADKSRWSDQQIHCLHVSDGSGASSAASSAAAFAAGAGVKCLLSLSSYTTGPRAELLVTGDKQGVIRLYSLSSLSLVAAMRAGDREIRCIDYYAARDCIVAGSRDGHIHLYDLTSLPAMPVAVTLPASHSSAVTAVKVTSRGVLVSISADRSIVFRSLSAAAASLPASAAAHPQLSRCVLKTGTPHALLLHPSERFCAVATSDRHIRVFDLSSSYREVRSYRVEAGGELTAMAVDSSGLLLAVCSADRSVLVVDWFSGSTLCTLGGHGSVLTGARWMEDGGRLVTVDAAGCLFIWKVDERWTQAIRDGARRSSGKRNSSSHSSPRGGAAGASGQLHSARRRRSPLDYLEDESEMTADSIASSRTEELAASAELDLLSDDEEKEERKDSRADADSALANAPSAPSRLAVVSPLVLPAQSPAEEKEQETEREREREREYKPTSALPDWARTQSSSSSSSSSSASAATSSSSSLSSSPPLSSREPKTSRWSLRAQSGYRLVSELDSDGVNVTPAAQDRRDGLDDTDAGGRGVEHQAGQVAELQSTADGAKEVEEEPQLQPERTAEAKHVHVMREEEVEEDIAAAPQSPLPLFPSVSSPLLSAAKSPLLAAAQSRSEVKSPFVSSLSVPPAVPVFRSGSPSVPSSASSPVASKRRSRPSSRSPSQPASPSQPQRQIAAPPSSLASSAQLQEALDAAAGSLTPVASSPDPASCSAQSNSSADALTRHQAQQLQSLQQQTTAAVSLLQQARAAEQAQGEAAVKALELRLFRLYEQLGQAIGDRRIAQLTAAAAYDAGSTADSSALSTASSAAASAVSGVEELDATLGGTGLVGRTLDRYSELLLEMIVNKMQSRVVVER